MTTPLLDIVAAHLPPSISASVTTPDVVDAILAFALGADCPARLHDARHDWARAQPIALKAIQDALGPRAAGTKRARDTSDNALDDPAAASKRSKIDIVADADDPPHFTLPSISTTSPVRKKVDITVHARSIRFVNPTTRALEASVPLATITRAFLLPTRGKTRGHWTVVLLLTDAPDTAKGTPSQQVIFGLDALSTLSFDTTVHAPTPTQTTITKGAETAPALRTFFSYIPVPLLEPSTAAFRSACANPTAGHGAAGIDAYLAAKSGTLWFFDVGILWGESKPCAFWSVSDLLPKDGVRLISATGRTCSLILSRKDGEGEGGGDDDDDDDVVETTFSMIDGREQDPIDAWARHRRRLFGKSAAQPTTTTTTTTTTGDGSSSSKESVTRPKQPGDGTIKGPAWDDSDEDDHDFEVTSSSEDLEHSASDSGEESDDGGKAESAEESDEEEAELDEAHHPLLRPGAMPRMSKAAINAVVDMVHRDLVDDASDEEDELEE